VQAKNIEPARRRDGQGMETESPNKDFGKVLNAAGGEMVL